MVTQANGVMLAWKNKYALHGKHACNHKKGMHTVIMRIKAHVTENKSSFGRMKIWRTVPPQLSRSNT